MAGHAALAARRRFRVAAVVAGGAGQRLMAAAEADPGVRRALHQQILPAALGVAALTARAELAAVRVLVTVSTRFEGERLVLGWSAVALGAVDLRVSPPQRVTRQVVI